VAFIALFHIEAALALRDHSSLHWRGQCPIVVADNVCARNFTVSSVRDRNSQWSRGECAEQLHCLVDIFLLAAVIKDQVNMLLGEDDCPILK
jgi:hypothetical protein